MFTSVFHTEQLPPFKWPGTCADFPTNSRYDVTGVSSCDVLMTWGFLDDDIYITITLGLGV